MRDSPYWRVSEHSENDGNQRHLRNWLRRRRPNGVEREQVPRVQRARHHERQGNRLRGLWPRHRRATPRSRAGMAGVR